MKSCGFTLVGILLTVAIIGSLSAISIPAYRYVTETASQNTCAHIRKTLSEAESMFVMGEDRHSNSIQELVDFKYLTEDPTCPNGYSYTWKEYDPSDPYYKSVPICPKHNPEENSPFSMYGNIIKSTKYLNLFDSGTLLSKMSDLLYVPDYENGTVFASLASGTEIQTTIEGGATVKFPDGTTYSVADIFNSWQYLKSDFSWSDNRKEYSGDYMYVGYGYAYEGNYKSNYLNYEYNYDPQNGSFAYNTTSTYDSTYSGTSLNTDLGYIYEGTYQTNKPSQYSYTYNKQTDGSYTGKSSYTDDVALKYSYGYNKQGTTSQFMYAVDGAYDYTYDTNYSYDASTQIYKNSTAGAYSYSYDYDLGDNRTTSYDASYTYAGNYTYNRATGSYTSEYTYNFKDGKTYTYSYSYDPTTGRYSYTYTTS